MENNGLNGASGGAEDGYLGAGGVGGGYDPAAPYNPYHDYVGVNQGQAHDGIDMDRVMLHEPFTDLKDKLPPALPGSSAEKNAGALRAIVGGSIVGIVFGLLLFA